MACFSMSTVETPQPNNLPSASTIIIFSIYTTLISLQPFFAFVMSMATTNEAKAKDTSSVQPEDPQTDKLLEFADKFVKDNKRQTAEEMAIIKIM